MRLCVLAEASGFRFLWEQDADSGPAGWVPAVAGEARLPVDAALAEAIEESVDLAAAALERMGASRGEGSDALRRAGALIHGRLIPAALRAALDARPPGSPLLLTLDAASGRIPWELSHDGRSSLAERLAVGRRRLSARPDASLASERRHGSRPRALILGNPNGDLPAAEAEAEALMDCFDGVADGPRCELLCRAQASRLHLLEALASGSYEILHFAGHARPGALRLADGWLGADEIRELARGRPLIYLNACRSGRAMPLGEPLMSPSPAASTEIDGLPPVSDPGLVAAFLDAGALAVIATLWPIFDARAGELALALYRDLLNHKPLGEALRAARLAMHAAAPDEAAWAAPLLHGDPRALVLPPGPSRHSGSVLVARWSVDASRVEGSPADLERIRKMADEVAARGGRVGRAEPGRLMAVFGVPRAVEDDAARAAETALALRASFETGEAGMATAAPAGPSIGPSIGLASGRVDLDPRGLGAHALPIYAGPALATAEALAKAAASAQVRVDPVCARLAGNAFSFRPLRPQALGAAADMTAGGELQILELLGRQRPAPRNPAAFTVGREAELDRIGQLLEAAHAGRGAVLGIVGEAGVGKSHLLRALHALPIAAELPWFDLKARPGLAPFGALTELLQALDVDRDAPEPRLRSLLDALTGRRELDEGLEMQAEDRGLLLHWLRGRLAQLAADGPVLVCVDDAQHLDGASLELLDRLAQGIERAPVLLALLYRPGWAHAFAHKAAYRQLVLGPLDAASSQALAEHWLDSGVLESSGLADLLARAEGNPFFVEESLRGWQETGVLSRQSGKWTLARLPEAGELPATVQRSVLARCDRLPAELRRVLDTAAILAEPFTPALISRMLGGLPVEALLERLEAGGFIEARWSSGDHALRHALVGEVVSAALTAPRRRNLHRRAALALSETGAADQASGIERLARHALCALLAEGEIGSMDPVAGDAELLASPAPLGLAPDLEAEDLRLASEALHKAGRLALDRYAARSALDHFRRASSLQACLPDLDAAPRAALQEDLGDALNQLGGFEPAIEAYALAYALRTAGQPSPEDRRRAADLARRIGRLHGWGARYDEGLEWMARGLALLEGRLNEPDRGVAALIHVHTGTIHYYRGRFGEALGHIERGLGIAEGTGHLAALATGQNLLGAVHDAKGERELAVLAYTRSLDLWKALGDGYQASRVADNLGVTRFHQGQWPEAAELHRQALDFFERIEDSDQAAFAALNLGNVALARGEIDAARQGFERALALGRQVGSPRLKLMAWLNLAHVAQEAGEMNAVRDALARGRALQSEHGIEDFESETRVALGRACLAEGDAAGAERLAREAIDEAGALSLALEEALARRLLGAARALAGDAEQAEHQLRWSARILVGLGQAHEAGRTELALAESLYAAGDAAAARDVAQRARARFAALGARLDLRRTDMLLERWGRSDVA